MGGYEKIIHPFGPVFNGNSKVLILGTMASVKSRETNFYYGHPQNRFWKVLAKITDSDLPVTVDEKKNLLLANHIAVWDVIKSCEIIGSDDNSIRNVVPNDFIELLSHSQITKIFTNGKKSEDLYRKFCENETKIKSVCLPSTSPANAAWSLERLTEFWLCSLGQVNNKLRRD